MLGVLAFGQALRVLGTGRGAKPRDELLKGASLLAHAGKRARKGKALAGPMKALGLVTA